MIESRFSKVISRTFYHKQNKSTMFARSLQMNAVRLAPMIRQLPKVYNPCGSLFMKPIALQHFPTSFFHALSLRPTSVSGQSSSLIFAMAVRQSSTMKKRRMKMNKHKLKKRRKLLRMNTKVSRG